MEIFNFYFPVSGVEGNLFFLPVFMFFVSLITSTVGVSGAFVLLPFQMSVLGYTSPGVTATNFIFNIVAVPAGAYKYIKDKKVSLSIFLLFTIGAIPGIFLGYCIRILYLPNTYYFRFFVGIVLFYLAARLLKNVFGRNLNGNQDKDKADFKIVDEKIGIKKTTIKIESGKTIDFSTAKMLFPSFITGIIGGAYGIGGGAIMVPYCAAVLNIPVMVLTGASLLSTWFASLLSAVLYETGLFVSDEISTRPDWLLGTLFGIGGFFGIWGGAFIQKYMPLSVIKGILGIIVMTISLKYLFQWI